MISIPWDVASFLQSTTASLLCAEITVVNDAELIFLTCSELGFQQLLNEKTETASLVNLKLRIWLTAEAIRLSCVKRPEIV
jgi:hypothetical protein